MSQGRNEPRKSDGAERRAIPGEEARQGSIILRTPLRRVVFIGCLLAIFLLGLVLAVT